MATADGLGLGGLPLLSDAETRSISAENPKGEKGAGATAVNHLGAGWKGRPCIGLENGQTTTLAEIEGPAGTALAQFPEALDYLPAPRVEQFVRLDPGESFDPQGEGFVPVQQFAWFRPTQPGAYRFRLGLDTTASNLRDWLGHTPVPEPGGVTAMIQQVPRVKVWSNTVVITFGSDA